MMGSKMIMDSKSKIIYSASGLQPGPLAEGDDKMMGGKMITDSKSKIILSFIILSPSLYSPAMPVEVSSSIKVLSQSEFHAIDERVMRIVFDVHNEYGRFFDEAVYKQAIAARYAALNLGPAEREVRIRVSHRTFTKDLFIDLLFDNGAVIEAKTAETLAPAHRSQTLSYLFLTGLHHARLVNLRPEKVEYEFVSTNLTSEARKQFTVAAQAWEKVNSESLWLKERLCELLSDWGAFLDVNLYREAITHFLGGIDKVLRPVEVFNADAAIGSQRTYLLAHDTAFVFTTITNGLEHMRTHQLRFLHHTRECPQRS